MSSQADLKNQLIKMRALHREFQRRLVDIKKNINSIIAAESERIRREKIKKTLTNIKNIK